MKKNQRGVTVYELLVVIFVLYIVAAWVTNLVKLVNLDFEAPYKAEVIRVISIVPVISMVTGFMPIEDGVETRRK